MFVAVCVCHAPMPHTLAIVFNGVRCDALRTSRRIGSWPQYSTHDLGYTGFHYCAVHRGTTTTLSANLCIDCCRSPSVGTRLHRLHATWRMIFILVHLWLLPLIVGLLCQCSMYPAGTCASFRSLCLFEFRAIVFDVPCASAVV